MVPSRVVFVDGECFTEGKKGHHKFAFIERQHIGHIAEFIEIFVGKVHVDPSSCTVALGHDGKLKVCSALCSIVNAVMRL